jgi:hypothetical protein
MSERMAYVDGRIVPDKEASAPPITRVNGTPVGDGLNARG